MKLILVKNQIRWLINPASVYPCNSWNTEAGLRRIRLAICFYVQRRQLLVLFGWDHKMLTHWIVAMVGERFSIRNYVSVLKETFHLLSAVPFVKVMLPLFALYASIIQAARLEFRLIQLRAEVYPTNFGRRTSHFVDILLQRISTNETRGNLYRLLWILFEWHGFVY